VGEVLTLSEKWEDAGRSTGGSGRSVRGQVATQGAIVPPTEALDNLYLGETGIPLGPSQPYQHALVFAGGDGTHRAIL
jgi:hypothetical protein